MFFKCQSTQVIASLFLNGRNTSPSYILIVIFFSVPSPSVETDTKVNMIIGSETEHEHSSALPQISSHEVIGKTLLAHRKIYCLA